MVGQASTKVVVAAVDKNSRNQKYLGRHDVEV
jgi:hypothetical protein